jgi:hypothetical protein
MHRRCGGPGQPECTADGANRPNFIGENTLLARRLLHCTQQRFSFIIN